MNSSDESFIVRIYPILNFAEKIYVNPTEPSILIKSVTDLCSNYMFDLVIIFLWQIPLDYLNFLGLLRPLYVSAQRDTIQWGSIVKWCTYHCGTEDETIMPSPPMIDFCWILLMRCQLLPGCGQFMLWTTHPGHLTPWSVMRWVRRRVNDFRIGYPSNNG